MSQTCPTCGKPVDPLRSRFVRVVEGKVVAYDSEVCRAAAETKPTVMPATAVKTRTPATGIPTGISPSLETGPVIEIVKEPTAKTSRSSRSSPRVETPPPIEDGSLDPWNAGDEAH